MHLIIVIGAALIVVTLATKYEFFEPAKEIAYISVDEELRTKGKAIAEIVGSRFGKSTGSALEWFLLTIFIGSDLISLSPTLLLFSICFIFIWIISVVELGKTIK